MEQLYTLADAVGVARAWRDTNGVDQIVADEALVAVVSALGYPAGSHRDIIRSLAQIEEESRQPPAMIVTETGMATPLPAGLISAGLVAEDGSGRRLALEGGTLAPIDEPGYYRLAIGQHELTLAVAPRACPGVAPRDGRRAWGPAIQIPALRGAQPQPFGHFGHLDDAVRHFARAGASAVAINPVHALFPGDGADFSPYSPSSRLFLNGAMGDPALLGLPPLPASDGGTLIDWEGALPRRLAELRAIFDGLDDGWRARVAADCRAAGEGLRRHAIFDALDLHFRKGRAKGWREWPAAYHDPDGAEVRRFAAQNEPEIGFHMFAQWLARACLAAVQKSATASGMAIGLLADLAVGVHPGGSDAWQMRADMLDALTIGAPPDALGPLGQDWQLTSFSPRGLRASGYAPWIDTLRASMNHSGGLRIDHAYGLSRLWVVPGGGSSGDGTYLRYPFNELLRLAALEAHRANAVIVAENLGTAPSGFDDAVAEKGMLGMSVLWFTRAPDDGFIGPGDYPAPSVAMTGTHDTATVAGWWQGRDLEWAEKLGRLPAGATREDEEARRAWDRGLLWATIGDGGPRPAPDDPAGVVEAALRHIARSAACMAIAPLEDLLAIVDQPNLPGTTREYPNWRRRLAAPLDDLLAEPETARRIETLASQPD